MNYLIDTHILLWCMIGDKRIDDEHVKLYLK
jgi:PIN domain nuclease of toxin-antitoxin system